MSAYRLRTDLAHTWAIGVGKEFCGSAILTIIDLGLMDDAGSLDANLGRLYADFRLFCVAHKESCKLSEFSKRTLKIPNGTLGYRMSVKRPKCYLMLPGYKYGCHS